MKRLIGLAALAGAAFVALAPALPSAQPTASRPEGWSDKSYYLAMRDGVRIAVSLYFPGGKPPERPAPVVLYQTRYGRATHFADQDTGDPDRWRAAGYVVAVIDTRGSTASFGPRDVDIGPDEVRDMDEVIAHLAQQPWSNGQVIAAGVSYMADTADWATSRPAAALIAALPRQTDFDAWAHLFAPGGVWNDDFLNLWGGYTREIDLGRDGREGGLDCRVRVADCPKLFPVLQPVDGDDDYRLLREALGGRNRWGPETYAKTEFRDDPGLNGRTLLESSPVSALAEIRRERKPVQYWGSWLDAGTAEAALARYRSAPEVPMEVWITANNHGHTVGADPFFPNDKSAFPSPDAQFETNRAFVERVRRGEAIQRRINYYVMGARAFRSTAVWPPADAGSRFLAIGPNRSLGRPPRRQGQDRYAVDFTASTGKATRWSTQFGTPPDYPDRRHEDRKLLVYDSAPWNADTELVGTPVVTLHMAAQTRDPAIFAYLETVAPDGRVTYLAEGMLRAVHRKPADRASLPYDQGPAAHSFRRQDALPVRPGEVMEVKFALFPVAALVPKGHRLRLAIGGADAGQFRRYSEGKPEVFTVRYGGRSLSGLEITTRPWRP